MITTIKGTDHRRKMMASILNDLHAKKPKDKPADYTLRLFKDNFAYSDASLITQETSEGKFRNVSILRVNGIEAAIGNRTGNISFNIEGKGKEYLKAVKKATKDILAFLEALQPKNRIKPKDTSNNTYTHFDFKKSTTDEKFQKIKLNPTINGAPNFTTEEYRIEEEIKSSNYNGIFGEVCKEYDTL